MTAPAAGPRSDDTLATLRELYPGRWAPLLVELCAPTPHEHREGACATPGKRPLAQGWHTHAVARWRAGPAAEPRLRVLGRHLGQGGNLGLAIPPAVVALDADTAAASAWLELALEDAPTQRTARGAHYLARIDGNIVATCGLELLDGVRVDVRAGERSQIVVEPSLHASGAAYSWRRRLPERVEDLPECPPLIAEALRRAGERSESDYPRREWDGELPARVSALLERDHRLRARWHGGTTGLADPSDSGIDLAVATRLAYARVPGTEIEAALRYRRREAGARPKADDYFARTVNRALASARDRAEPPPEPPEYLDDDAPPTDDESGPRPNGGTPPRAPEDATDDGLAERFARLHGEDLVYVPTLRRWFAWDRRRFRGDDGNTVRALMRETARGLLHELVDETDSKRQSELALLARKARAMSRMRAALWIAEADPRMVVRLEELDADPWLLNVQNGTLDLRTGKLCEHRRSDRLTRLAPVAFDPRARSPLWETFLERIQPDADMRAFLQRAAGYSLTADTSEECTFIAHGPGANGKSTYLETLRAALGTDYAAELAAGALTLRERGDELERLLAPLPGIRLATTLELHEGQRLREAAVKHLTSGEPLRARFLYSESFEFRSVAKFWIGTNHRPAVGGDDEGIWRRLRLVPFEVQIPEDERDKRLREKLRAELPGVLRWAVAGCLAWQRDGLAPPETVLAATRDYRSSEDLVGTFVEDCAVLDPRAWVPSALLHRAFARWARAAGAEELSQRALADRLRRRGLEREKLGGHRGWRGLDLTQEIRAALERDESRR